jgi:ribosomal protein L16/L10AE
MEGVPQKVAEEAMRLAAAKLSVPTKFVARNQPADVPKAG